NRRQENSSGEGPWAVLFVVAGRFSLDGAETIPHAEAETQRAAASSLRLCVRFNTASAASPGRRHDQGVGGRMGPYARRGRAHAVFSLTSLLRKPPSLNAYASDGARGASARTSAS